MSHYLSLWLHLYIAHFGAWVSFSLGATIYRDGLPKFKEILPMLGTAVVLSAILSLFSSHSHSYLMDLFKS